MRPKGRPKLILLFICFKFIQTDFEKNPDEIEEIPEVLEKYLDNVAQSGDIVFKWEQFKPLIKKKIQMIAAEFNEAHPCDPNLNQPNVKPFEFEEVKRNILSGIDSFTGAPFTIQRICELLTDPYKHYKRADKFLKGLEKNVMVISEETVDQSKTENGNTSGSSSLCLNATFTMPSTSDSIGNNQSTAFHNGYKDNQPDDQILPHQQLDSFTTVFVSSSQTTTSHLERIASLQILEQSTTVATTVANQHTISSQLSAIQPFLATASATRITRTTDPALDSLEKITQEIPIVELQQQQQPLVADVIIETVNSEQPAGLGSSNGGSEQIVPAEDKFLEVTGKATDEPVASEGEAIVAVSESQSLSDRNESTGDVNSEQQKEETEVPVREQSAGNDLKRVHENDEIESADESFKRFKANESAEESEKASQESVELILNDSVDELEQPLDVEDRKEESTKIDQESADESSISEQTVEQAVEPDQQQTDLKVATENRPAELSVTEDSSQPVEQQQPATKPFNECREALATDASGDKLKELQPETDPKEEKQLDNGQEKEN